MQNESRIFDMNTIFEKRANLYLPISSLAFNLQGGYYLGETVASSKI